MSINEYIDMEKKKIIIIAATVALALLLVIIALGIAFAEGTGDDSEELRLTLPLLTIEECPEDYGPRPLLVISVDGFIPEYLKRERTPTLQAFAEAGVKAEYMIPTYPSVTYPSHYTMVTGLYPESHGIIDNNFFDPEFQSKFTLAGDVKDEGRWWGGEPIWNTLAKYGKKSAPYYWPGSSAPIGGQYPTYWFKYNTTVNFFDRIDKVFDWLSMPEEERPIWISLYFDQPDLAGHYFGLTSSEVDDQLELIDSCIKYLLDGLAKRNLGNCVNIIILSDHGMSATARERTHSVMDFVPNIKEYASFDGDAIGKLTLLNKSRDTEQDIMRQLSCKKDHMRVYTPGRLPKRLHYANNRRIEDIIIDLDPGYMMYLEGMDIDWKGNHGYDTIFPEMNTVFLAYGPDFQRSLKVEPFQSIELYNLMCHLTGVSPAENNGTWGALHHLLLSPPAQQEYMEPKQPPILRYPKNDLYKRLSASGCSENDPSSEPWMPYLDLTEEQEEEIQSYHAPWGIPYSDNEAVNISLLYHLDHVTGYSSTVKMPLWSSFTIHPDQEDDFLAIQHDLDWVSDARLKPKNTPTCTSHDLLRRLNFTMTPLFPHEFSNKPNRTSHLVSNAVPVSQDVKEKWKGLMGSLVPAWLAAQGPLNIVLGPVFDYNSDSHPDDFAAFSNKPIVPTDLFAVLTRCRLEVTSLDQCPMESLDSLSFIFHQDQPVNSCSDMEAYALKFSSRVRDVELVTGLNLFSAVPFEHRVHQVLRLQPQLWPLENI